MNPTLLGDRAFLRMTSLRLVTLFGSVLAVAASCIKAPTDLECTPTQFSIASTSGDTTITTTGLRYIDGAAGVGDAVPWCEPVTIHYTGYLLDGTEFDNSRDNNSPLRFRPGFSGVIDGVEQGVIGMRTNGTRRLIIPPELGYGALAQRRDGVVIIPANSTLVFDIEVTLVGD